MNPALEAVATGLRDGGVESVYNFPGFHSHEIAEFLGVTQISLNERVAYAEAYGASVAGSRSVVTFKNVGLNVAADAFLHSLIGGVNAGLVIVVTDDTLVVGSQEFQDSRHFYDFYGGIWLEPTTVQEAYDMAQESFVLSERLDLPVVIRLGGVFFQQKGEFERRSHLKVAPRKKEILPDPKKYVVHPYYFTTQERRLKEKRTAAQKYVDSIAKKPHPQHEVGVIVCGPTSRPLRGVDVMTVTTLPIPMAAVHEFIAEHNDVTVYEDGDPVVHDKISATLSQSSILHTAAHPPRGVLTKFVKWQAYEGIFSVINHALAGKYVSGDITQFTVETTDTVGVALSLGVAVGTAIGVAEVQKEAFAIVGDTSFLHEGRGVVEEARKRGVRVGIIILDNGISWCTGGQTAADDIGLVMEAYPSATVDARDGRAEDIGEAIARFDETNGVFIIRILVPYVAPLRRN
jgi:indolepyruvate ferredoxin oxidoreductase alpha subunit